MAVYSIYYMYIIYNSERIVSDAKHEPKARVCIFDTHTDANSSTI